MNYLIGEGKLYKELIGSLPVEMFLTPYHQPHRYFHTEEHLIRNVQLMNVTYKKVEQEYLIANLFHDNVYDPRKSNNEEKSAEVFSTVATNHPLKQTIIDIILDTKNHTQDNPLNDAELQDIKFCQDIKQIRTIETNIFKEFQFHSVSDFVKGRTEFLKNHASGIYQDIAKPMFNYSIGLYCGSFNPIHQGHLSIIEQAEKIFDKVIIAVGVNPEKIDSQSDSAKKSFPFHEVLNYYGLLTDFITELETDFGDYASFTLIRGLRNGNDLAYENNQLEFMKTMKADIKVVMIPSDKSKDHISSTAIRNLAKYNKEQPYLVGKYSYAN